MIIFSHSYCSYSILFHCSPISTTQRSGWCSAKPGPAHHALTDVAPLQRPSLSRPSAAWRSVRYGLLTSVDCWMLTVLNDLESSTYASKEVSLTKTSKKCGIRSHRCSFDDSKPLYGEQLATLKNCSWMQRIVSRACLGASVLHVPHVKWCYSPISPPTKTEAMIRPQSGPQSAQTVYSKHPDCFFHCDQAPTSSQAMSFCCCFFWESFWDAAIS